MMIEARFTGVYKVFPALSILGYLFENAIWGYSKEHQESTADGRNSEGGRSCELMNGIVWTSRRSTVVKNSQIVILMGLSDAAS
jgi:hypothetical protein